MSMFLSESRAPVDDDADGPPAMDAMNELTRPTMAALSTFNGTFLQNAAACQKEWLKFLQLRIKENLAMPGRLSCCRSLPEIQAVYADYWSRALGQYQDEFQTLTQTALGHSSETEKPVYRNGGTSLDVPRAAVRYESRPEAH